MGGGEYGWGVGIGIGIGIAPISTMVAPLNNAERDEYYWRHVNSSMNAVSFGFVATAILISMFLIMAIFEKFLRPRSSSSSSSSLPPRNRLDLEAQMVYGGKHGFPSPKMTVYARGVSVLMPGEEIPTFIAHPAPVPCPPEQITWPPHQHNTCFGPSSTANSTRNQM